MRRITDDDVQGFLIWARNYGEIESYKKIAESGRKWLIRLPATVTASNRKASWTERRVVPSEFVLTSREALAFGYGLAVAGACPESRREFAARVWGWGDE